MAIYIDHKLQTTPAGAIHVDSRWHPKHPILAVASYAETVGGYVKFYNEEGSALPDLELPEHLTGQVTSIAWHPLHQILAIGWESGEIAVWNETERQYYGLQTVHPGAVCLLQWSTQGQKLVSADVFGSVVGWKCDTKGSSQTAFHHELKDPVSHVVFRLPADRQTVVDISNLARAAVNGDESALDLFSTWRPKTAGRRVMSRVDTKEDANFFIATFSGAVYFVNESGTCAEVLQSDGPIKQMLYRDDRDSLIVITEDLTLGHFQVEGGDGVLSEVAKVKLSGRIQDPIVVFAGTATLAVTSGDLSVRVWNMDEGDNCPLTLEGAPFRDNAEYITTIDYNSIRGILAFGTNLGNVALWKRVLGNNVDNSWELLPLSSVKGAIKQLSWFKPKGFLCVNVVRDIVLFKEQVLCAEYQGEMCAVQTSPYDLVVQVFNDGSQLDLKSAICIKHICVSNDYVAIFDGQKVIVYEILPVTNTVRSVGSFTSESELMALYDQSLYFIEGAVINVRSFQGTVKQTLTFLDVEGNPITLDISGPYLTVTTEVGIIKIYELSKKEMKPLVNPKNLNDLIEDFGEVICARCNADGTKIALTVANSNLVPDARLYVWDIEADKMQYLNFASGKRDSEDHSVPPNSARSDKSDPSYPPSVKSESSTLVSGRVVISHLWDIEEPKLLVCEAAIPGKAKRSDKPTAEKTTIQDSSADDSDVLVVTLFASSDIGLVVQDTFPLQNTQVRVLGMQIPYCCLLLKPAVGERPSSKSERVERKILRDFVGLESSDKATCEAAVNFSFYLSIGNMDEAFKAIKSIKSESVWENMARMCVKTKRLDVAAVCLGNMKHVRGVRALRASSHEPELDVRVAVLAMQLGMLEEAESLLQTSGRYDVLCKFYKDSGKWEKAIQVAEEHDRINLRTVYYQYAKHLEAKGDLSGSIKMYEESDSHRYEVPRMLFDDPQLLENYIVKSKDSELQRWWAQYMESAAEMDTAVQFYTAAEDYLSLVRVYCYCGNWEKASEIANDSGDRAACYHLARQYENSNNVKMAVHFFTKARAFGSACRVCREQGLDEQLWNLALMAGPSEQLEAARYFEKSERPNFERAVMLYHRSGYLSKAVDLAFESQQFNALQYVAMDLDKNSDPALLERCARFFIEKGQFARGVDMLIAGKKYFEALDLCTEHNVSVTEEMADRLTIQKGEEDEQLRIKVLERIGECCFNQGNFHLATKKFTQAGNKVRAMKALLKSGDTEKITFFANVSRQREIYIMAANYLQSVDWHKNPDVMKNIVNYYTKGRALDLLAGFYESCAHMEIDEYRDYNKALGALNEAQKSLSNSSGKTTAGNTENRYIAINAKLEAVKQFVNVKSSYSQNPSDAMTNCRSLLDANIPDAIVRAGDVYAFMVEHYVQQGNNQTAYHLLEEMKSRKINIGRYVDAKTMETIRNALDFPIANSSEGNTSKDDADEVEEELQEHYDPYNVEGY